MRRATYGWLRERSIVAIDMRSRTFKYALLSRTCKNAICNSFLPLVDVLILITLLAISVVFFRLLQQCRTDAKGVLYYFCLPQKNRRNGSYTQKKTFSTIFPFLMLLFGLYAIL